jgi:uncharacterized membrane protein
MDNGEIGRMSPAIREIIDGYARLEPEERDLFRQMLDGIRVDDVSELQERAARANRQGFEKFLAAAPDVPPMPGDEL